MIHNVLEEALNALQAARQLLRVELSAAIHTYYEKHSTGGVFHIVLDDGNVSDADLGFCHGAVSMMSNEEALIYLGLSKFSELERQEAYAHGWDFVAAAECDVLCRCVSCEARR